MSIVVTLIGIVILLGIVSTIFVDGDLQLTIENAKEFSHRILDTVEIWRA